MKVAFCTLGCKVNQYESQSMEQALIKRGFECVGASEEADVYIVNSCTVTAESDRKTRQNVRHLRKLHPDAVIVLTGRRRFPRTRVCSPRRISSPATARTSRFPT